MVAIPAIATAPAIAIVWIHFGLGDGLDDGFVDGVVNMVGDGIRLDRLGARRWISGSVGFGSPSRSLLSSANGGVFFESF